MAKPEGASPEVMATRARGPVREMEGTEGLGWRCSRARARVGRSDAG